MFNKRNNKKGFLSELDQNKNLKQVIFFGFYILFFAALILLFRNSYKNTNNNTSEENLYKTGFKYDYKLDRIKNNNYHFIYKENTNGNEAIYEGDIFNNKVSFFKSGVLKKEYYIDDKYIYQKDNNLLIWNLCNNPMIFYDFTLPNNLESIFRSGTYTSRTNYIQSNKKGFSYFVSNSILGKILNVEVLNGDLENMANIIVSSDGRIDSIYLDLTNYYKNFYPDINKYELTFYYSKYDQIEEITNPIN